MQREKLGSRLGFILLSAGCAIGLGNVYKFPYIAGQNGGAIFVLVYLACLLLLGLPIMTMEFAMGRAAQKSPVRMYDELKPKSAWGIHGWMCLTGNVVLLMCYCTIAGWLLQYFVDTAAGRFAGLDTAAVAAAFGSVTSSTGTMAVYTVIVVALATVVCSFSLQGGLERITKWMMLALLGIMIILAVNSCMLPGASEGLKFYLLPSWERFTEAGFGNVVVAAMNQAFFSLSLGIGSMAIFGSYLKKERTLMGEAVNVVALDTFVALTAGLIIFPACSSFGVQADSGAPLIFITLPNIFNNMTGGRIWGSLFFLFMAFAALSTVFAVFENIVSCVRDLSGWERKKTSYIVGASLAVLCMPCVLSLTVWSDFKILGLNIMDFEDFLVSSVLLPLGSLIISIFCVVRYGWGWDKFVAEANEGRGLKLAKWMRPYMTYVLPVITGFILFYSLYSFFK